MLALTRLPWSWIWALSIVVVWLLVAYALGQQPLTQQHSLDLVQYGAFKGSSISPDDAWRLIASQWLHLKFPHMLFNALIIGIVGQSLINRFGAPFMVGVGVIGGAAGQLASALVMPEAYISGASQAYLALTGLGLLTLPTRTLGWWASAVGTVAAIGLDVFVSDHAFVKIGHALPFALGVACGVAIRKAASK